jgi:hypothetical protein
MLNSIIQEIVTWNYYLGLIQRSPSGDRLMKIFETPKSEPGFIIFLG